MRDTINRRYGNGTIHTVAENAAAWKPNQTNLSPRFTTEWGEIIEVGGN
jgi:DNA polymerase V